MLWCLPCRQPLPASLRVFPGLQKQELLSLEATDPALHWHLSLFAQSESGRLSQAFELVGPLQLSSILAKINKLKFNMALISTIMDRTYTHSLIPYTPLLMDSVFINNLGLCKYSPTTQAPFFRVFPAAHTHCCLLDKLTNPALHLHFLFPAHVENGIFAHAWAMVGALQSSPTLAVKYKHLSSGRHYSEVHRIK